MDEGSQEERVIGAPQVLEIPVQGQNPPEQDDLSSGPSGAPESSPPPASASTTGAVRDGENASVDELIRSASARNYLGLLYATVEEGGTGVAVLDVVPGSPAARAGFRGMNQQSSSMKNDLMKAALVVLMMSPVGPFAIPLAIAHDLYTNRNFPGDIIAAVDGRPVRDAQEFSEEMRRYKPGDTVTFSILRAGKSMQLPVQLGEEPA
jgi:S1-C subfamily serine protease